MAFVFPPTGRYGTERFRGNGFSQPHRRTAMTHAIIVLAITLLVALLVIDRQARR